MKTIEVSDETYEKIKDQVEADKKPKEFAPIKVCHITISAVPAAEATAPIYITGDCHQTLSEARRTIKAIQSAIDFVEKR